MKKIIIIGNKIGAKTIYGYLSQDKRYQVDAFCVDKEFIEKQELVDLPVVSFDVLKQKYPNTEYTIVLGIGYTKLNQNRENMFLRIKDMGYTIETYIHPSAIILNGNKIGEGSMVFAGSIIEPNTIIGENSLIWSNCVIAHNAEVKDNCWIAANSIVSAEATIQNNTFIGVNCTITNHVEVSEFNIIGAGALISKNTKPNEVYLSRISEKHRFDSTNYSKFYMQ